MGNDVKITDNTDKFLQAMEQKIEKALVSVGMQCEGDAKLELESDPRRVDTGRLRNSITYATTKSHSSPQSTFGNPDASSADGVSQSQAEENAVVIGTNVEYGIYVHEGTTRMSPNRFLRNAVERNEETYHKMIDDVMKEE